MNPKASGQLYSPPYFFASWRRSFAAQDKYSVRVPNGLAFSDFRGTRTGRLSPSVRLTSC